MELLQTYLSDSRLTTGVFLMACDKAWNSTIRMMAMELKPVNDKGIG